METPSRPFVQELTTVDNFKFGFRWSAWTSFPKHFTLTVVCDRKSVFLLKRARMPGSLNRAVTACFLEGYSQRLPTGPNILSRCLSLRHYRITILLFTCSLLHGVLAQPQWPPQPLTGGVTVLSGLPTGNGYYYTSCSTYYSSAEIYWQAFDQNLATIWTSSAAIYSGSGSYTGTVTTVVNGLTYAGEWLQIQLPVAISLASYGLYTRAGYLSRGPLAFIIAGSLDGINFFLVDTRSAIVGWPQQVSIDWFPEHFDARAC